MSQSPSGESVRVVLFDAVGTLIYPQPPVAAAYHRAGRRHGSLLSETEIAERFRQALRRCAASTALDGHVASERQERDRWRRIVGEVFEEIPTAQVEPLFGELWRHFADSRNWAVFDDVAPAWRELRRRGVQLGVASNFDSRLAAICNDLPPLNTVDEKLVFSSSDVGWSKPGRKFFEAVETRLGAPGGQIMLVGDDFDNDVAAARAAGWNAELIDRRRTTPESMADLTEIVAMLA